MLQAAKQVSLIDLDNSKLFINGEWATASGGSTFSVKNPNTGEVIAEVPRGAKEETKAAIEAANAAFPKWAKLTANERADYLLKVHDLMLEHEAELATIMSKEMGKAYTEACGEVKYAASFLSWYAEEGRRIYGETIPASSPNKRLLVVKQPVGVIAAITPWNFPLAMMTRKLGPALAAGCTGIVKPASQSPLSALAFASLVQKAGIPNGVVNIVAGATGEISDEIFANPIVKKVSFTGSTDVGKKLVEKSAEQLKKLSLELGGHAPFIVFEDADLEKAAEGAVASKFRNAGQTCVCANRIYVHENIKDEFTKLFVEKVQTLKVGNSLDQTVQIGPLVNKDGLEKVQEHVKDAKSKGAEVLTGGKVTGDPNGFYFEPTILGNVTNDMIIMTEETFGPVAPITTFSNDEDVIFEANNTEYGLAAYLYTSNIQRAVAVSEALNFGVIGLNDAVPGVPQAPFGGMNHSGYGREGGHQGIRDYLEEKYISLGL
ncbi:NAD-dependent succinate-semialdehyde dehydrogenase [Peribacillus cavernae]|uniref:NAD-dependent succinate-semialdehyde dehydrogenase n=1 Tax=Peribacillus cavernae TaxID=1674310 RepID=A0A3S0UCT7_9BACI|nr:NAD-dependent succinate-semialdehyde dehydrogenase [Peribacillus cavernae]MDQ0219147.1 succinate-semialdehyde dehydrogenase/glutarate-semialdehyde dehydrogenase [Peribacillus cavernae]RUQ28624.1 NAD-dependent succinate-semialdehyde dehydrogenase [Peribacillus cavernae]